MAMLEKPALVIRLGFAGARAVEDADQLSVRLRAVFERIAEILVAGADVAREWYAPGTPVLRLTTGLAEGADLIAARSFRDASGATGAAVVAEAAAVVPFSRETYRSSLDPAYWQRFDEELAHCRGRVIELDGRYIAKPSPPAEENDKGFGRYVRSRAYRGQATVLLRQCDLLLAAYDPSVPPKAGGTVETVRNALELGIPVVVIPLGLGVGPDDVAILRNREEWQEYRLAPKPEWRDDLADVLHQWVIPPPLSAGRHSAALAASAHEAMELVSEFFGALPRVTWLARQRQNRWAWFESWFKPAPSDAGGAIAPAPAAAAPDANSSSAPAVATDPFKPYRDRAAYLARFYNSIYRGTFLMNYFLAIVAILVAVIDLRLILADWPNHNALKEYILLLLTLTELTILLIIVFSTEEANHHDFNGKAIDHRYLAERLRAQPFLAMVHSGRPPTPGPILHAARAVRLTVVEWLFQAIVRQGDLAVSPCSTDPEHCLAKLKSKWLEIQAAHHEANAAKMAAMREFAEKYARWCGVGVVGIVVVDLIIVVLILARILHHPYTVPTFVLSTALVPLTALLPALVASLNGVRFQTECDRMAERSTVMFQLLVDRSVAADALIDRIARSRAIPADDDGAWSAECLLFAESCARVMADEVADWSVLYSKNIFEV
jgi:hypothetical membrane protein